MTLRNIKLTIQYDGTEFSGWQYQPDLRTVQGEIQAALRKMTGDAVTLYGAGRTDAGVHALGQAANFRTASGLAVKKFRDGLNFHLPHDILIHSAEEVQSDFHARYDAVCRRYQYQLGTAISLVDRDRRWEVRERLDFDRMDAAADWILGEHDFSAVCVMASRKPDNRCLVYHSRWREDAGGWRYEITANRFLHTMIRSLVGLMVDVGRGRMTVKKFRDIAGGGDHRAIPRVAPARGLCLIAVEY